MSKSRKRSLAHIIRSATSSGIKISTVRVSGDDVIITAESEVMSLEDDLDKSRKQRSLRKSREEKRNGDS